MMILGKKIIGKYKNMSGKLILAYVTSCDWMFSSSPVHFLILLND